MSWVAVGARFHLDEEAVGREVAAPHLLRVRVRVRGRGRVT